MGHANAQMVYQVADFTTAAAEADNAAALDRCYKYEARMLANEAENFEKATDVYLLRKVELGKDGAANA